MVVSRAPKQSRMHDTTVCYIHKQLILIECSYYKTTLCKHWAKTNIINVNKRIIFLTNEYLNIILAITNDLETSVV